MTTTVLILRKGGPPDKTIHVHENQRDEHGHFKRSQTYRLSDTDYAELNVHDGAQLEIHEADASEPIPGGPEPNHTTEPA